MLKNRGNWCDKAEKNVSLFLGWGGGIANLGKKLELHIDEGLRNMHTKFQWATTIRTCSKIGGTKALEEGEESQKTIIPYNWKWVKNRGDWYMKNGQETCFLKEGGAKISKIIFGEKNKTLYRRKSKEYAYEISMSYDN